MMPAPVPSWTGWYVGLNAGHSWGNADPSLDAALALGPTSPLQVGTVFGATPALKPSGFIGGGQLGYNWQMGQFLLGGELDFSGMDAKASASVSPFFSSKSTGAVSFSSRFDWLFTARARGGFLITPDWLLYVTGGLAVTHVRDSAVCTPVTTFGCSAFNSDGVSWSDSSTLAGGTVGAGIEARFAANWTARFEYLHAKFKDTTPSSSTTGIPGTPFPSIFTFKHDLNVARFAINYKFAP
jgi:outer membrane immunogenic protein